MKTENITKAIQSFDTFCHQLREAHTDAVNCDAKFAQFAELTLFGLIEESAKLKKQLDRVKNAIKA